MKEKLTALIILVLAVSITTFSQSVKVTFSGKDARTDTVVPLDSVRIENLSSFRDTVLHSNFVIDLGVVTGIGDHPSALPSSLELSGNFANPFIDETRFQVGTPQSGSIEIRLYSLNGTLLASVQNVLANGVHEFILNGRGLSPGVYLLVVNSGNNSSSTKIVKTSTAVLEMPSISYLGSSATNSLRNLRKSQASTNYRFIGYTSLYSPDSVLASPIADTMIVFRFHSAITIATGTINSNEIGTNTSLYVQSTYGLNNPIDNDRFSVPVSTKGTQLLLVTDTLGTLRGLTLSLISGNSVRILQADVQSTVYGLLFLTPGISTTQSDSTDARLTRIGNLPSFRKFVEHLRTTLSNSKLLDLLDEEETRTLYLRCICDYADLDTTIIPRFTGAVNPDPDPYFRVTQTNNSVELKNYNWRWVNVYRRDLKADGTEASVKTIFSPMFGGVPYSWGCVFTNTCLNPTVQNDNSYSSISTDVYKSEYWIVGKGLREDASIPPASIFTDIDFSVSGTTLTYFVLPSFDILLGGGSGLSNVNEIMMRAISITNKLQQNSEVESASNELSLSTEIVPLLRAIGNLIMKESVALTTGAAGGILVAEGLITTAQAATLAALMPTIGLSIWAANSLIWAKLIRYDTPMYSKYEVFSTRPVLREPADKSTDNPTALALSCYPVIGANAYTFQVSTDLSFNNPIIDVPSTSAEYQVTQSVLANNQRYYWRVKATISSFIGDWSETWSFTTQQGQEPILTTTNVTNITQTTATSGGTITSDGGSPVTARGVCWSTTPSPTILNDRTTDGTGVGSFVSNLTGLAPNTTYYLRAYAMNSVDTGYGDEVTFTTNQSQNQYTIYASKDSYCEAVIGSANYNNQNLQFGVASSPINMFYVGLFFDLPSIPSSNVSRAQLILTRQSGSGVQSVSSILPITCDWSETQLTSNFLNTCVLFTPLKTISNINGDLIVDITDAFKSWLNNPTNYHGFLLNPENQQSTTTFIFYDREHGDNTTKPKIEVATQQGGGVETVTIGTQVWMLKNLDVTTYRNGDPIPQVTDATKWANLTTGAWCYYNNDPTMDTVYGKLYNWYAVNDPRGLAPQGWHVPDSSEWVQLITYLEPNAGGKLKEPGTLHWQSPNVGATNSTNYTAMPGGCRYSTYSGPPLFGYMSQYGYYWSSTGVTHPTTVARHFSFGYDTPGVYYGVTYAADKKNGHSVRCVKD